MQPDLLDALARTVRDERRDGPLPEALRGAFDRLDGALRELAGPAADPRALSALFEGDDTPVLLAWCEGASARADVDLAGLLHGAVLAGHAASVAPVARSRVIDGPLVDALRTAPLLGDGHALASDEAREARARLEILLWEAGASAREEPALGPWIWGSLATFDELVRLPSAGTLRGRVLAARTLEVAVGGLPAGVDAELEAATLKVLQPLLFHPEPLVWVHAARALGRLTGPVEALQGTLLDWVQGDSRVLRQRAMTAFASLPAERLALLSGHLAAIVRSPEEDAWVLAAIAAATPYLFFERRDLWVRLADRIVGGDGGAIAARALARGLATIHRREGRSGDHDRDVVGRLRALRRLARRADAPSLEESRRWIEVISITDVVDGAERDPLDLELGLENLVRIAAQYDDEEADARAARFAGALLPTFQEALRIAQGRGSVRHRAGATNAVEGCARAFALRLWAPLLATRPPADPVDAPKLEETWAQLSRAPADLLEVVRELRAEEGAIPADGTSLEVLALRLGGYALDACGEDAGLGPGRGRTAHDTCLWLRNLSGLADGTRELPESLATALSALFWRLVDSTRGTALGAVDDVRWLGPFAAWWALVIDRPAMLERLSAALPMMSREALTRCCEGAEALRAIVSIGEADGAWGPAAAEALARLHADDTELGVALAAFARALHDFREASGRRPDLDAVCLALVLAADRLYGALSNPEKALHAAGDAAVDTDSLDRRSTENAPRVGVLVARAIRARALEMLDVWLASLGPIVSGLVEAAVRGAIRRTPPPPPAPKKKQPEVIAGYELVRPLGEGGIGKVWLVRKPGADRLFVLKIPKAEALANATDEEREGILASFVEEAKALAGLYHPNVANIIDRGVSGDAPFMVLEYLIGADLSQYAHAQKMSLFELRQVVVEACAGLSALHGAGLVHRDVKPANLWLRLPLSGGERFEPKHRNPAQFPPLATVVIDFGMVRAIRVTSGAVGKFVAGTAGYIAPEQVLDPVELDPRADVYALAATICSVTQGRSFFDDIENPRDRIIAHMRRDPFEDPARLQIYPAAVQKLLRAAVQRDPRDRPTPAEFGRAFSEAL